MSIIFNINDLFGVVMVVQIYVSFVYINLFLQLGLIIIFIMQLCRTFSRLKLC